MSPTEINSLTRMDRDQMVALGQQQAEARRNPDLIAVGTRRFFSSGYRLCPF